MRSTITPPPKIGSATASKGCSPAGELSLWIRLGLPLSLALLAGGLNAAAIRRQITPTVVYAVTEDLLPGMRLAARHLRQVEIAGNLDRTVLVTPQDLLALGGAGVRLTLEDSLADSPRYVSRPMLRGELITIAALNGRESVQPGSNEELINVPRRIISGGDFYPGQIVYFLARARSIGSQASTQFEIGPFRVALQPLDESLDHHRDSVPLIYQFAPTGELSESADILRAASFPDSGYQLTVLEKSSPTH